MANKEEIVELLHAYDELKAQEALYSIQIAGLKKSAIEAAVKAWLGTHSAADILDMSIGAPGTTEKIFNLINMIETYQTSVDVEMKLPLKTLSDKIAEVDAKIRKETLELKEDVVGEEWKVSYQTEGINFIDDQCQTYFKTLGLDAVSLGYAKKKDAFTKILKVSKK
jgi:hypothetical protein